MIGHDVTVNGLASEDGAARLAAAEAAQLLARQLLNRAKLAAVSGGMIYHLFSLWFVVCGFALTANLLVHRIS